MTIFRKDPEVEKVMEKLSKKLDDTDDWQLEGYGVTHRNYNLKTSATRISTPEHIIIPYRWRLEIGRKIKAIHRIDEVDRLSFVCDILDDKYPYHIHRGYTDQEQRDWLEENGEEDQCVRRGDWFYFSDETLAMAYKLKFT